MSSALPTVMAEVFPLRPSVRPVIPDAPCPKENVDGIVKADEKLEFAVGCIVSVPVVSTVLVVVVPSRKSLEVSVILDELAVTDDPAFAPRMERSRINGVVPDSSVIGPLAARISIDSKRRPMVLAPAAEVPEI